MEGGMFGHSAATSIHLEERRAKLPRRLYVYGTESQPQHNAQSRQIWTRAPKWKHNRRGVRCHRLEAAGRAIVQGLKCRNHEKGDFCHWVTSPKIGESRDSVRISQN